MIQLRQRDERGRTRIDWLDSYHTFSFGDYYDPAYERFSDLRVINDDRIAPSKGFATHPHRNMEIVTVVLSGTLAHKDSLGNGSLIHPGEVQCMSAGTGIQHSEFNPSDTDEVHLLQIWILPEKKGLEPGYEQRSFPRDEKLNRWCLIASRDGRDGSVIVHQDVSIYATILETGHELSFDVPPGRAAWAQLATGVIQVNGSILEAGDGLAIPGGTHLDLEGLSREAELLLFDLRETTI